MNERHQLEEKLQYKFNNKKLLMTAVTHSSYVKEHCHEEKSNERLEFLGDAFFDAIIGEELFHIFPQEEEGFLSRIRATLVCEKSLAQEAKKLELGQYLLLGNGEEKSGGRTRESILADCMEAIIGAVYLDGGFEHAKTFIHKFILTDIEHKKLFYDCKTSLQEVVQGHYEEELNYRLISEEGPDHDKRFSVEARIGERVIGTGIGHTKKAAEQEAAYQALLFLKPVQKK